MFIHALIPLAATITTVDLGPPQALPAPPVVVEQAAPWTAWHGCWELIGEDATGAHTLCVVPAANGAAVRLLDVGGPVAAELGTIRADGVSRPVDEGGCTGTERAVWSRDGRRVFMRTELDCSGLTRLTTRVLALVSSDEWVDVQSLSVAGQHTARTFRYRAVSPERVPAALRATLADAQPMLRETARMAAAAPLQVEDVIEATSHLAAPALQALLAARGHGFTLAAAQLVALEAAGVPAAVIDVMVALSYPARFAVREHVAPGPARSAVVDQECYDPFLRRRPYGVDCRALGYRYGDPYGFDYGYGYGRYDPWRYGGRYGPTTVVVVRFDEEVRRQGEVVKGQGYTPGGATPRGTAQPRNTPNPGMDVRAASPTTTTTTTSSGSSPPAAGSSGTSTGRTAVPRPGGGGS